MGLSSSRSVGLACVAFALGAGGGCGEPDHPPPAGEVTHRLAAGGEHSCVLREHGLYCWGANGVGELGTGTMGPLSGPVRATAVGDDVVEVAANMSQTCVRRAGGSVDCWGWNVEGQLGDGTVINHPDPRPVMGIDDAAEVATGGLSACVRRKSGTVACWGSSFLFPVDIEGLRDVVELRGRQPGPRYCARTGSGSVYCWDFDDAPRRPALVQELDGARSLALTLSRVCGITPSNQIRCVDDPSLPGKLVEGVSDAVELVATAVFFCWRRAGGQIGCHDDSGLFATPGTSWEFPADSPAVELAGGQVHMCARLQDGGVACFNDPTQPSDLTNLQLRRVAGLPL